MTASSASMMVMMRSVTDGSDVRRVIRQILVEIIDLEKNHGAVGFE
jgi:hypothetical protein